MLTEPPAEVENSVSKTHPAWILAAQNAEKLLSRSRRLIEQMHDDDKEEAINLHEHIEAAIASQHSEMLSRSCEELQELLFFADAE